MMKESGVRFYEDGNLICTVGFANGKRVCMNCPFAYAERELDRIRCRITSEILHFPNTERGQKCPIVFQEDLYE